MRERQACVGEGLPACLAAPCGTASLVLVSLLQSTPWQRNEMFGVTAMAGSEDLDIGGSEECSWLLLSFLHLVLFSGKQMEKE